MKNISYIQLQILKALLFAEQKKFSELKPKDLESSHLSFYLESLMKDKIVEKDSNGYRLTKKGKEYANRFSFEDSVEKIHPKVTSILCGVKKEDGKIFYLVYKRLKHPFYGRIGFPTHKLWYGEKFEEAATEGFTEECGLKGNAKIIAIRHFHVYFKDTLVEDKLFHIFKIENPTGEISKSRDGEYFWIEKSEARKVLTESLLEFEETLDILETKDFPFFREADQITDYF